MDAPQRSMPRCALAINSKHAPPSPPANRWQKTSGKRACSDRNVSQGPPGHHALVDNASWRRATAPLA
eukprot:CAMPEP_0174936888 /NCGR_PEP_ID=MMETSP1355-20121228/58888_1 /TAXON_ID=464990 /ORGANISM="Hemiselmis tepida, Strain CCMP443" /LENGTH=67 /DNA_ID=CAMNT_0016183709 /DNA_START=15 /DNA_END=214 /DNA_ORIENTATION=+